MFKDFIKVTFILLLGSINLMGDNDFYLKINLLNSEKSKDSNSQRYIIEIRDKNVTYHYNYSGFPDNKHKSKKYILSDKELSDIMQQIKDRNINESIEEIKPTKSNGGTTMSVNLSVLLLSECKITQSTISGNTQILRADGEIMGEIIKNIDYVNNVVSLIQDLKR